jgi:hypothetical protein
MSTKDKVLNELNGITDKAALVNWLVKNFNINQLTECLESFGYSAPSRNNPFDDIVPARNNPFDDVDPKKDEKGIKGAVKKVTDALEKFNPFTSTSTSTPAPSSNPFDDYVDPNDPFNIWGFGRQVQKIQRFGARRNMYITAIKGSGKSKSKSLKFLTYGFKNGKWDKKGSWKSFDSIKKSKQFNGKTSKAGLQNFFGLKNLYINKSAGFGSKNGGCKTIALQPVHPMSFGYARKGCNEDRTYGQLFPLGKNAYVKGQHKGVSSTFSEAFAKRHGLYPASPSKIPNKWTYNQSQFGKKKKKKTLATKKRTTTTKAVPKKKKTTKAVPKKKKTTKAVPKNKKTTKAVPKKISKVVKTKAKKLGIKLTLKKGDKRVAKSETLLKRQISKQTKRKDVAKKKKDSKKKKSVR